MFEPVPASTSVSSRGTVRWGRENSSQTPSTDSPCRTRPDTSDRVSSPEGEARLKKAVPGYYLTTLKSGISNGIVDAYRQLWLELTGPESRGGIPTEEILGLAWCPLPSIFFSGTEEEVAEAPATTATGEKLKAELDDLLDEIDEVLEVNSEEFVRSFIQKGGE